MTPTRPLALLATALVVAVTACGAGDDTADDTADVVTTATIVEVAADNASTDDATNDTNTDEASTDDTASPIADDTTDDGRGRGGPGAATDASSVTTVDGLAALVEQAYGDPGLGLHRGHQDVESLLVDVLGISHDEMHVRMDAGQNLAAVAADLDVDVDTLIDTLVASRMVAVDAMAEAGTIVTSQAAAWEAALTDAYTFRVTWNGSDATPSFTGV